MFHCISAFLRMICTDELVCNALVFLKNSLKSQASQLVSRLVKGQGGSLQNPNQLTSEKCPLTNEAPREKSGLDS